MPEEVLEPSITLENPGEGTVGAAEAESMPQLDAEPKLESGADRKSEQYAQILSQVSTAQQTSDEEVDADANAVGALEAAEQKVHQLVELAQVKGVTHAVRVAKRMNDLFVLDTMHDELADKLYEGLVAKGLVAKE